MNLPASSSLFRRTAFRLRLASFGRRWFVGCLALSGVYALVLLASRLLGLIPDGFHPATLAAIPVGGALVALFMHHRAGAVDAARAIDESRGTKDLFVTTALLDKAPGEFAPLVALDAEKRAAEIKPADVVPFVWHKPAVQAAGILLVLWAGTLFLPQWDPFGKVAEAQQADQQRQLLADSRKAAQARLAEVRKNEAGSEQSKEVEKAIEDLKTAFNQAQPREQQANLQRLAQNQKALGEKWKMTAEKLKELMSQRPMSQQFGGMGRRNLEKWAQELQQGSPEGLRKELDELQQELQRLAKTDDPVERAERTQQIRKRMQDLADFAREKANSKPLSAALERAMQQLDMARSDGFSSEALEALAESLELSQLELEELAQSARDLQQLEQALKTLQMAKRLNDLEMLDGEACAGCQGLDDYEALYAQLMARMAGEGEGEGAFGDAGIGRGGIAPEDDSIDSDFKTERSRSAVTAGKILLSLKTQDLGDPAEAEQRYREQIREVRQGYSEAVLQERIPPGYHEGIKRYFDSIDQSAPPAP